MSDINLDAFEGLIEDAPEAEAQDVVPETKAATGEEKGSTPEPEGEETKAEAEAEEAEAETGADKPEPEAEKPEEETWTLAAVMAERDKRQKAQKELEELKRKLQQLEKPDEPRPDIFEDPDGAISHLQQGMARERLQDRINISRDFMQMMKPDYEQRETEFMELVQQNPSLAAEMREHPNPARFAYETAEKHAKLREVENLDDWKAEESAKLEAKIRAELKAELEAKEADSKGKRKAVTPSLAASREAGKSTPVTSDVIAEVFPLSME